MWKTIIIGIVTGFLNGLFGSGGGTVLVPSMERLLGIEPHKAHATAIAVILPLSIISCIIYFYQKQMDWLAAFYVSLGGMIGGFLGAKLLQRVSVVQLHKIFGVCMIAAAIRMIF